ncbi:nitrate- and nitrite sensing domain-containing protein [Micromonospora chersina]|uniref:sensor histidine kinase n=1 Tax=Micromonospora chersina TaxID=47854 RepID=UPI00370FE5DC
MRSRTNVRTKVVAMLASLTALWAFAAWVTLRDGLDLLWANTLNSTVYEPSAPLLTALQQERRLTLAYLGGPGDSAEVRTALDTQRRETEQLAATFKESSKSRQAGFAGSDKLSQRLDATYATLDGLRAIREAVDARTIDRTSAGREFGKAIDNIFDIYAATASLDDKELAGYAAALIQLNRMSELISQEDALMSGILASGRITEAERAEFTRLVGAQRFAGTDASGKLSSDDRGRYDRLLAGDAFSRLRAVEDQVVARADGSTRVPVAAAQWRSAVDSARSELRDVVDVGGDGIVSGATTVAVGVIIRLLLAAGLGTVAVVASIVLAVTTARALVRELERLRKAAHELADERLPGVVRRLGLGETVDVAAEAPPLAFGSDEIGQVGDAFNRVQETAIRTAVEQAELRRNVREVFLSLARRTQALVHRQLTLLDAMERREHDAEELEDLFRVDHLATRMRRNAENLIVLSGSTPGRAWRRNVPMVDVVRGAVAEVEDYTRVTVRPLGPVSLTGRAVGDVIHLLAELIENGLSFSPPHTTVEVRGQMVANGFAIEIEDRGLGMGAEELAAANRRIVDRSELNLANAARLGLFVVSRLTERHGVKVQLKESAYGGTTAVVLIPLELVTQEGPDASTSGAFPVGTGQPAPATPAPAGPEGEAARPAGDRPAAPVAVAESTGAVEAVEDGVDQPAPAPEAEPADPRLTPSGLPARTRKRQPAPAEAAVGLAVDAAPAEPGPADDAAPPRTDGGLPVRVRQASLAPELRHDPSSSDDDGDDDAVRPPEQVRRMMSSYQSGTRRGRTDAARLLGGAHEAGTPDTGDGQAT